MATGEYAPTLDPGTNLPEAPEIPEQAHPVLTRAVKACAVLAVVGTVATACQEKAQKEVYAYIECPAEAQPPSSYPIKNGGHFAAKIICHGPGNADRAPLAIHSKPFASENYALGVYTISSADKDGAALSIQGDTVVVSDYEQGKKASVRHIRYPHKPPKDYY